MTVEAFDIARQAAWEVAAVDRAVKRYQETALVRDPSELPPGRRVLAETVGPVSAQIEARLDEAAQAGRQASPWHAPALGFAAEVLAFVSASTALRAGPVGQSRLGITVPGFSRRVAGVLRDQADHDRWVAEQKSETEDEAGRRALARWRRLYPDGSRRAWLAFSRRIDLARSKAWPESAAMALGGMLANSLAEAAPRWFEVGQAGEGPAHMRPLCVLLTDHAVERMADVEARAEVSRPLLLPMLIPPSPWRYAA